MINFQLFTSETSFHRPYRKKGEEERAIFTFIIAHFFRFILIKTFITFYGFCFNPRGTRKKYNRKSFDAGKALKVNEIFGCMRLFLMKSVEQFMVSSSTKSIFIDKKVLN
jgi:hypothetical protein